MQQTRRFVTTLSEDKPDPYEVKHQQGTKERKKMSRVFEFRKGRLTVDDRTVTGTVKGSTSMQQMPGELAIDTPVDKFGPISINEVGQFKWILSSAAVGAWEIIGLILGLSIVMASSGFEGLAQSLTAFYIIIPISTILGIVTAVILFKKIRVYMAQFSNAGQTIYIPYLKQDDQITLRELDAYVREIKRKSQT